MFRISFSQLSDLEFTKNVGMVEIRQNRSVKNISWLKKNCGNGVPFVSAQLHNCLLT